MTSLSLQQGTELIARNQNTYAKRQREMEKKEKAEEKRVRRLKRKEEEDVGAVRQVPVMTAESYAEPD